MSVICTAPLLSVKFAPEDVTVASEITLRVVPDSCPSPITVYSVVAESTAARMNWLSPVIVIPAPVNVIVAKSTLFESVFSSVLTVKSPAFKVMFAVRPILPSEGAFSASVIVPPTLALTTFNDPLLTTCTPSPLPIEVKPLT